MRVRVHCVCEDKDQEPWGLRIWSLKLQLLSSNSVRITSHLSSDSTPKPPSRSELCNPVWAAFSLASNFGSLRPASMFATPPWLKFLNLFEKPRPKFLASSVFCSTCSEALFPGTLRYLLRLAPCLLRASRSGARLGYPFFSNMYTPSSFNSDPSVSAAVFAFVNLNMLLGCQSTRISSIVVMPGD